MSVVGWYSTCLSSQVVSYMCQQSGGIVHVLVVRWYSTCVSSQVVEQTLECLDLVLDELHCDQINL